MGEQSEILNQLKRLASGDESVTGALLALVGDAVLHVPVLTPQVVALESGLHSIDVLTMAYGERRLVPCFTQPEYFSDWTAGRYDSLNILGSELALALPDGASMFVNPGTHDCVEFDAEQVKELATLNGGEPVAAGASSECGIVVRFDPPTSGRLERELTEILAGYDEVREGYYLPAANYPTSGVIGLVTRSFSEDRRYLFVSEISEIAKRYFGAGNALEIFDEGEEQNSSVWDLFHSVPPFYRAPEVDEPEPVPIAANGGGERPPSPLRAWVNRLWR